MGKLSFRDQRYYFAADTKKEAVMACDLGLRPAGALQWATRNHRKARSLRMFADASAERKLKRFFITQLRTPERVIYADHLEPRWWQVENAWHALSRTPSYIADDAGLGKTISAILAINSDPGEALIVCPPYLAYNWIDEIEKWGTGWEYGILPDSKLIEAKRRLEKYKEPGIKWLIIDEAHRYKTPEAQRTRALLGGEDGHDFSLTDCAQRVVLLSGTPVPNGRPIEIFSTLSALATETLRGRSKLDFGKLFCGAKITTRYEGSRAVTQWDFSGASNLGKLKRELQQKLMIRHTKEDCLKELGPKTRQVIFLDLPTKIHKLEKKLFRDIPLDELMSDETRLGDIATYRKEVGLAKLRPSLQYIEDLLDGSDEKLVVAAYHVEVVETLAKELQRFGALKIRGGMSALEKQKAVKAFQTKSACRVIVGNTLAMGLGNTMTASCFLVTVEPEWTSGVNEQMEDRIHRMTQERHVYCRYLVLRNSLDERMLRRALAKESNIRQLMN